MFEMIIFITFCLWLISSTMYEELKEREAKEVR